MQKYTAEVSDAEHRDVDVRQIVYPGLVVGFIQISMLAVVRNLVMSFGHELGFGNGTLYAFRSWERGKRQREIFGRKRVTNQLEDPAKGLSSPSRQQPSDEIEAPNSPNRRGDLVSRPYCIIPTWLFHQNDTNLFE